MQQENILNRNLYRNNFMPAGRAIRYIHEATALDELVDVDATSPANGDILEYDSVSGKWRAVSKKHTGYIYTTGKVTVSLPGTSSTASADAARAGVLICNLTANHSLRFPAPLAFYTAADINDSRVSFIENNSAFTLTLVSDQVTFRGDGSIPALSRGVLYWNMLPSGKWECTVYRILTSFSLPPIYANQVTYSPVNSGLTSTNVNDAIDEVKALVDGINNTNNGILQPANPINSINVINSTTITADCNLASAVVLQTVDASLFPLDWINSLDGSTMTVVHTMNTATTITNSSASLNGITIVGACPEWDELGTTGSYVFEPGRIIFNFVKFSGSWRLSIGYDAFYTSLTANATTTKVGMLRIPTLTESRDGLNNTLGMTPYLVKDAIAYNLPLLTGFAEQGAITSASAPTSSGLYINTTPSFGSVGGIIDFHHNPHDSTRLVVVDETITYNQWNNGGGGSWTNLCTFSSDSVRNTQTVNLINTNRPYSSNAQAIGGTHNTSCMTPLRTKEAIDTFVPVKIVSVINDVLSRKVLYSNGYYEEQGVIFCPAADTEHVVTVAYSRTITQVKTEVFLTTNDKDRTMRRINTNSSEVTVTFTKWGPNAYLSGLSSGVWTARGNVTI